MYVDDIRNPKGKFDVIVRSSEEAIEYIVRNGCPSFISFDHDLGGDDTSMNVVRFIVDLDLDSDDGFIPYNFNYFVHSANPVGKANIEGYLNSYLKHRKDNS